MKVWDLEDPRFAQHWFGGKEYRTVKAWDVEDPAAPKLRKTTKVVSAFRQMVFLPGGDDLMVLDGDNPFQMLRIDASLSAWMSAHGRGMLRQLAFDPTGRLLAIRCEGSITIWNVRENCLFDELKGVRVAGFSNMAFSPSGDRFVLGYVDGVVVVYVIQKDGGWLPVSSWEGTADQFAFHPSGKQFASAGRGGAIMLWDSNGSPLQVLEGHTEDVSSLSYSHDGRCLVSQGDRTIRFWNPEDGRCLEVVWCSRSCLVSFDLSRSLLAVGGSELDPSFEEWRGLIRLYKIDLDLLLAQDSGPPQVFYTSAKIVLLGDSGVGKTGLGWRLAHGEFREHPSTHGQQFWLMKDLCRTREDGAECEAVLWDLAGQDDYRLIHALFLDDADLALLLFDPSRREDPLAGVDYWLKHLKIGRAGGNGPAALLLAARSDRGSPRLTTEELEEFCKRSGIHAYLSTSALRGDGLEGLMEEMNRLIPWATKPTTVTTATFKRIKDHVLGLKEVAERGKLILTSAELREVLQATDADWVFGDDEMLTAIGHLETHGYVIRLKTSRGEPRILLAPDLLNNLAASLVLEARRQERGLGSLEEKKLLAGGYSFPELQGLGAEDRDILLDSAAALFLKHTIAFRATDLLGTTYLIFPELINLKRPLDDEELPLDDGAAYTLRGPVENVYASLVVLMGYTPTFSRASQWRNQARYEVAGGEVCGFRVEEERAGELDLLLYYGCSNPPEVRRVFESLFEVFLSRRQLEVRRFPPLACENGHPIHRTVMRDQSAKGASMVYCPSCGLRVTLPRPDQATVLSRQEAASVAANRRAAEARAVFEQILFKLKGYVADQNLAVPDCFISYAWGEPAHERWVEQQLATDLRNAGVAVIFDRWENRIATVMTRFLDKAVKAQRVILVGTPSYARKYENGEPMNPSVLAVEADLICGRVLHGRGAGRRVLPILLEGSAGESLPPLFQNRIHGDFREPEIYLRSMLDLLLALYGIDHAKPPASDWIRLLGERDG